MSRSSGVICQANHEKHSGRIAIDPEAQRVDNWHRVFDALRNAARLIHCQHLRRVGFSLRLARIDVCERLAGRVLHDIFGLHHSQERFG